MVVTSADTSPQVRSHQIPRRIGSFSHRQQQHQQQQHQQQESHFKGSQYQQSPLIQEHQPFPSSTSSFSFRNSTSSSSFLGANDYSTRISQGPGSAGIFRNNSNGSQRSNYFTNIGNHTPHYNYIQPSSYERRAVRSFSFGEGGGSLTRSGAGTGTGTGTGTRTISGVQGENGRHIAQTGNGSMRPRATTMHESFLQLPSRLQESTSDLNSLYTIDNNPTTLPHEINDDPDDDELSYFGSAGQDFLLKGKRARLTRIICWIDFLALVGFTCLVAMVPIEDGSSTWSWDWSRIPNSLAIMAIARILGLSFTARYSHGNYNVGVIFLCGLVTLYTLFEINMVIQHRIAVVPVVIVQYMFSMLITQIHWIVYSVHTPMSATLAYAYDPILHDSITFSRESRYMGSNPTGSRPLLRRGTSYGTMSGSPFAAVQELEEEPEEDDDDNEAFIKVNVDVAATSRTRQRLVTGARVTRSRSSRSSSSSNSSDNDSDSSGSGSGSGSGIDSRSDSYVSDDQLGNVGRHRNRRSRTKVDSDRKGYKEGKENKDDEEDEEEDQDMAVLLAFQEARRQQVFAFSPTASSSIMPDRSILSSHGESNGSPARRGKSPLSWAFQPQDSYASSYDMRIAAAGARAGAGTVARGDGTGGNAIGYGLTMGYKPRKRTLRSNFDPNGTARRTWTGGHSIIYSGILVESSDDDVEGGEDGTSGQDDSIDMTQADELGAFEDEDEVNGKIDFKTQDNEADTAECAVECSRTAEIIETAEEANGTKVTETTETIEETETIERTERTETTEAAVTTVTTSSTVEAVATKGQETCVQTSDLIKLEEGAIDVVDTSLKVEVEDRDNAVSDDTADKGDIQKDNSEALDDLEMGRTCRSIHAISTVHNTLPEEDRSPNPHEVGPTGNKNLDSIVTFQDDKVGSNEESIPLLKGKGGNGVSTVKVKLSSSKQITALLCEDDACEEHPRLGGPPPDVDLGPNFPKSLDRANIVDLDIKESSTASVERIGPDGDATGPPRTIRYSGTDALDADGALDVDKIIGAIGGHPGEKEHGSRELRIRERIENTTRIESEEVPCTGDKVTVVGAADSGAEPKVVTIPLSPTNEPTDSQGQTHLDGGQRRVHIKQKSERLTIEETDVPGSGPKLVAGGVVGGVGVVVGGSNVLVGGQPGLVVRSGTVTSVSSISTDDRPMPEGWIGRQDRPGVVTWGYATDVDQPSQVILEPTMYIPPEQPILVGREPLIQTVEPTMIIEEPRPIIAPQPVIVPQPRPQPVLVAPPPMIQPVPQPRMMIQPRPAPVLQQPIRAMPVPMPMPMPRPVAMMPQARPLMLPQPAPMMPIAAPRTMVAPPVAVPQPVPMPIAQPIPMPVPQPMPIAPMPGPVMAMPRPMMAAPASEYAYYDDIASIYEAENPSIVSINDDRSIASIYEYENRPRGMGMAMGYGPSYGPSYGHHLAAAAHISGPEDSSAPHQSDRRHDSDVHMTNRHEPQTMPQSQGEQTAQQLESGLSRQLSPLQRVLDQQHFYRESAEYTYGNEHRHGPSRQQSPRYLNTAEHRERGVDVYLDSHQAQGQMSPRHMNERPERQGYFQDDNEHHLGTRHVRRNPQSGAEASLEYIVNRHATSPKEKEETEPEDETYHAMELGEGAVRVKELALETYYDTTKSQLKTREQQGNALAERVFQLHNQANESPRSPSSPVLNSKTPLSSESVVNSNEQQNMRPSQNQPPILTFPKPPSNPPPVRLLVNRGLNNSPRSEQKAKAFENMSQRPTAVFAARGSSNGGAEKRKSQGQEDSDSSLSKGEVIMMQARHQRKTEQVASGGTRAGSPSNKVDNNSLLATAAQVDGSQPPAMSGRSVPAAMQMATSPGQKKRRKEHFPSMSRHHLHPSSLNEGVWATWNNEFGSAMDIFKEHATTYPRWCLAAAEVHIVRQLISGQLSEPDMDLTDALQLSEKIGSRVLDKKQEFDASYMKYRSICAADASLVTVNENTLRQNYKWDCEMAFYDTLLYRGILQLTSSSDTKGTFTDIKGGLQLRRAWKGYMRIKQEMEVAKEKWQRLSALNAVAAPPASQADDKENVPTRGMKNNNGVPPPHRIKTLAAVSIPPRPANSPPTSKRSSFQATSQQPSDGARWSIFGRRGSWAQSGAPSSSSPVESSENFGPESGGSRSRILGAQLGTSPSKGLASALRGRAKVVEEFPHAVKVLEDVEDYLQYGIGLFYFIVSIVPKSLLPALRTIGLQTNHEQGIQNFEAVLKRKNARAPFAVLFLLINYLFLPRGMADPNISLGRAGEILNEALRRCPNGSSYLLMACHHARKTGNMIPSAMNHITRGIQTCEAAGIPSINYRFELGLTFFIHQEFGKAADIFEILWRKYITMTPEQRQQQGDIEAARGGRGAQQRRKTRNRKGSQPSQQQQQQQQQMSMTSDEADSGSLVDHEEDEEDDFELAPFCGLCLIACKVVMRIGQEGYYEYGRGGFGRNAAMMQLGPKPAGSTPTQMEGIISPNSAGLERFGPDFDLLMAAHEVLAMMSPPTETQAPSTPTLTRASTSLFEHVKAGSNQSFKYIRDLTQGASTDTGGSTAPPSANQTLTSAPSPTHGKLNRFNKFTWNQCQKSIQKGRISPFLPLVILYLRRDLACMKPVLLRKFRTLLESIWKTIVQPADADTQAVYLLLNAVVHRQLLPDDTTFAYTALTDCLLLESMIETEMWVIPYCHYELGEVLYRSLQLPQAALEQFEWVLKGPGKEARPASVYVSALSGTSASNPRLSVFGGGFPSDAITQMVESASQAQFEAAAASTQGGGHAQHLSGSSQYRLSQFFSVAGRPTSTVLPNAPNPMSFYNARYKKFEFSQVLRQRSLVCIEQIQKAIGRQKKQEQGQAHEQEAESKAADTHDDISSVSRPPSQALQSFLSESDNAMVSKPAATASAGFNHTQQDKDLDTSNDILHSSFNKSAGAAAAAAAVTSSDDSHSQGPTPKRHAAGGLHRSQTVPSQLANAPTSQGKGEASSLPPLPTAPSHLTSAAHQAHFQQLKGWSASTLPNILTDAQRKRGSQQWMTPGAKS
ncbi:hypothetical protein BGZ94_007976 [Podila epigama]|nr:hypothetical protein BGZ94_007976 [Podila epigama]